MLKVMYIRKEDGVLESFLSRQIKNVDFSGVEFSEHYLDFNLSKKYNLINFYNVVILDDNDQIVKLIQRPFSTSDIEEYIQEAKEIISKRK